MHLTKHPWVAAGLLAATVLLAGCNVDAEAPTDSSAPVGEAVEVGDEVTGDPIVIGTICSCTGPVSSSTGQVEALWGAWEQWTNTHGGINGHPVDVIVLDDGLDAAKSLKLAKELIEEHQVMAIVGEMNNLDALWADYARDQGVPVIGAAVYSSVYETNPMFFPTGAQTPTQAYGALAEIEKLGKSKVGLMVCAESPTCADNATTLENLSSLFSDVEVVSNQRIAGDAPNYTAACLAAKDSGAEVILPLVPPDVVPRVVADCKRQGYEPDLVTISFVPGNDWAKDPNLEGFVTVAPNQSLFDASIDPTKEFSDALNTFAQGIQATPEFNASLSSVWAAAQVFKEAATRAEVGPDSTSADVLEGLYTFDGETLEGLVPPLTYTEGEATPSLVGCWYVSTIEGGAWTAPNGGEASCIPTDQEEAVKAAFVQP